MKTKGYAALAEQRGHRRHFPETTLDVFGVLFVTTTRYRAEQTAKQVAKRPQPGLWLFVDARELTPETFLHGPITWNCALERGPFVKLPPKRTPIPDGPGIDGAATDRPGVVPAMTAGPD